MVQTVAYICIIILIACMSVSAYRLSIGPSLADRAMASDHFIMTLIGIISLYSVYAESTYYFDLVLVFSLLGFVGMVCFAKFVGGGKILQ